MNLTAESSLLYKGFNIKALTLKNFDHSCNVGSHPARRCVPEILTHKNVKLDERDFWAEVGEAEPWVSYHQWCLNYHSVGAKRLLKSS